MGVLTKQKAQECLSEFGISDFENVNEGEYADIDSHFSGQIECVSVEGGEGDGASIRKVFRVNVNGGHFYFRISGTYSSWADTEYDDAFEIVEPREVTVTQYFPR